MALPSLQRQAHPSSEEPIHNSKYTPFLFMHSDRSWLSLSQGSFILASDQYDQQNIMQHYDG